MRVIDILNEFAQPSEGPLSDFLYVVQKLDPDHAQADIKKMLNKQKFQAISC